VRRDEEGLARCAQVVAGVAAALPDGDVDPATSELRNLSEVARHLVAAARQRTESRGTHSRVDHPGTDDAQRHRIVSGGPIRSA
jgi:L-aspartate oxidase